MTSVRRARTSAVAVDSSSGAGKRGSAALRARSAWSRRSRPARAPPPRPATTSHPRRARPAPPDHGRPPRTGRAPRRTPWPAWPGPEEGESRAGTPWARAAPLGHAHVPRVSAGLPGDVGITDAVPSRPRPGPVGRSGGPGRWAGAVGRGGRSGRSVGRGELPPAAGRRVRSTPPPRRRRREAARRSGPDRRRARREPQDSLRAWYECRVSSVCSRISRVADSSSCPAMAVMRSRCSAQDRWPRRRATGV